MELLCINSSYSEDFLKIFTRYNIRFPKENEIVTLDRWEKLSRIGKTELFVIPYTMQYINGSIYGIEGEKEVSFNSERFTTLLGEKLSNELLNEFKQEQKGNLEPIKPKENDKYNN